MAFSSELDDWRENVKNNIGLYGVSEITRLKDGGMFYADLPQNLNNDSLIKTNYRKIEFGMMYNYKGNTLKNYDGSFFVRLLKSDGTEFSFIAELGKDAIYLDGDDYLCFYIPESFCGEHVKVFVTVLTDDFPDYIDEVFFYLGFPRSK